MGGAPVDLLVVKLDRGPITRKLVGSVGDEDGLGVEDETDDALVRVRPAFGNLIVKLVQVVDNLRRLLHLALVLIALLGDRCILAIDKLAQPGGHIPPHPDEASEVANGSTMAFVTFWYPMSLRATISRGRLAGLCDMPHAGGGRAVWTAVRRTTQSSPLLRRK